MNSLNVSVTERWNLESYTDVFLEDAVVGYIEIQKHILSHLIREFVEAQVKHNLVQKVCIVLVNIAEVQEFVL